MNDYKKEFDLACDKIVKLEEKNKKLKAENKELKEHKENLIQADKKKTGYIDELEEKLKLTENDRDEREVKARDLMKKLKEIEKAYI